MAVEKVPSGTSLKIQFQTGLDGDGDPVYRTKSLSNVKTTALDQDIYDVAQALVALQEYSVTAVLRVDSAVLEEEI